MKARLEDFRVCPFDPMELRMLPPGEVYVQIHLVCDAEMAAKLADFFRNNGVEGAALRLAPGTEIIAATKG